MLSTAWPSRATGYAQRVHELNRKCRISVAQPAAEPALQSIAFAMNGNQQSRGCVLAAQQTSNDTGLVAVLVTNDSPPCTYGPTVILDLFRVITLYTLL